MQIFHFHKSLFFYRRPDALPPVFFPYLRSPSAVPNHWIPVFPSLQLLICRDLRRMCLRMKTPVPHGSCRVSTSLTAGKWKRTAIMSFFRKALPRAVLRPQSRTSAYRSNCLSVNILSSLASPTSRVQTNVVFSVQMSDNRLRCWMLDAWCSMLDIRSSESSIEHPESRILSSIAQDYETKTPEPWTLASAPPWETSRDTPNALNDFSWVGWSNQIFPEAHLR